MATILFWNVNKKQLIQEIVFLCHHHEINILILAELEISEAEILTALNTETENIYIAPSNLSKRLSFFFRYPLESITPISDEGGIAIRRISPPVGCDILLVALHLTSKRYMTDDELIFSSVRVAELIREAEDTVGHNRTIVIGDLNMNPFEAGVVGADAFHAVMDRNITRKRSRKVQGQARLYFYNPMWGRMGDCSVGPLGTYYYKKSGYISYFWNTFDQVLLRPELLDCFHPDNLTVISEVDQKRLLTPNGISKSFSDHLPIMIKLEIERMIQNGQ